MNQFPITTTFELPGADIVQYCGAAYGIVVRSMGFAKGIGAAFKGITGGEVSQYTRLLEDSRRQAVDRLIQNAIALGGNAVVGMRFDSSEIAGQFTEIVAYGTAVIVQARPQ